MDQLDPRELIARITAEQEHDSPSGRTGSTGRHAVPAAHDPGTAVLTEYPPPGGSVAVLTPTGAHRIPEPYDENEDEDEPVDDARERDGSDRSVVEIDRETPGRRWRTRRLAPLAIGGAAVLAATLVFTLLQPGSQDPDLASGLLNDSSRRSVSDNSLAAGPALGGGGGSGALSDVTQGATSQIGAARAAQAAEKKRREAAEAGAPAAGASGNSRPAAPGGGAAQVAGDGVQAALKLGWGAAGGDEFTGGGLGAGWTPYEGAGHAGNGRRTADAVSVENGNLVIRGDSQGNTGGIAWGESQKYGKWEMRAKFPKGDKQYHPVLLLWPSEAPWPEGGEIDFAETNSAADDVSFFLHYGGANSQETAKKALDLTQWHNYAVEWTPDGIRGFVDGVQYFESTNSSAQPPGPMHATIQLDYFPDGGSPQPSEMQVAWMRQYK